MNSKMSLPISLIVLISVQVIPGEAIDPIKYATLIEAANEIPLNVEIRLLTPILVPFLLLILNGLGPIGVLFITALNYFSPFLTPLTLMLKDLLKRLVQTIDPILAQVVNLANLPVEAIPKLLKIIPFVLPLVTLLLPFGSFGLLILWKILSKNGILQHLLGNNLSLPTLVISITLLLFLKQRIPDFLAYIFETIRIFLGIYAVLPMWVPLSPLTFVISLTVAISLTPVILILRKVLSPAGSLLPSPPLPFLLLPQIFPLVIEVLGPFKFLIIPILLTIMGPSILTLGPLLLPLLLPFLSKTLQPFLLPLLPLLQQISAPILSLLEPLLPLLNPILPFIAPALLIGPFLQFLFSLFSGSFQMFSPLLLPVLGPLIITLIISLGLKRFLSSLIPFLNFIGFLGLLLRPLISFLGPVLEGILVPPLLIGLFLLVSVGLILGPFRLFLPLLLPFLGLLVSFLGPLISTLCKFLPLGIFFFELELARVFGPLTPVLLELFLPFLFRFLLGPLKIFLPLLLLFLGPLFILFIIFMNVRFFLSLVVPFLSALISTLCKFLPLVVFFFELELARVFGPLAPILVKLFLSFLSSLLLDPLKLFLPLLLFLGPLIFISMIFLKFNSFSSLLAPFLDSLISTLFKFLPLGIFFFKLELPQVFLPFLFRFLLDPVKLFLPFLGLPFLSPLIPNLLKFLSLVIPSLGMGLTGILKLLRPIIGMFFSQFGILNIVLFFLFSFLNSFNIALFIKGLFSLIGPIFEIFKFISLLDPIGFISRIVSISFPFITLLIRLLPGLGPLILFVLIRVVLTVTLLPIIGLFKSFLSIGFSLLRQFFVLILPFLKSILCQ